MNIRRRVDTLLHMDRERDDSRERCHWVILPSTLPVATPGPSSGRRCCFSCGRACGPRMPGLHRQRPLCSRQRLDPPLFIHRQHDGTVRRIHTSPTVSCALLPQAGSRDTLDVLAPGQPCRLVMLVIVERIIPVLSARADSTRWKRCGGGDIATPVKALSCPPVWAPCPAGAWRRTEARRPPRWETGPVTAGWSVSTCRSRPSFPTDRSPGRNGDDVRAPCVSTAGPWVFHDACWAPVVLFRRRDRVPPLPAICFCLPAKVTHG